VEQNKFQEVSSKINLLRQNKKGTKMFKSIIPIIASICIISQISTAQIPTYTLDKTFNGKEHTGIKNMALMSKNRICCLNQNKEIIIIDTTGKEIKRFSPNKNKKNNDITTITVDDKDNIYTFESLLKTTIIKRGSRKYKRLSIIGTQCTVYDQNLKQIKQFKLENIKGVSAATITDNKLIIANLTTKHIDFINLKTYKVENSTKKIRTCCGIFDFSPSNNNTIMVGNLGAFKVQQYDKHGKLLLEFGKRGRDKNDFHGCCNPVSVSQLSSGYIVTAEKSPTRIKVYDKKGKNATIIPGIQELVKGCLHVPMLIDKQDNIYLASYKHGIVKCIPNKK